MSFEYHPVVHKFSPGTTIEKILKHYNHPNMSEDAINLLLTEFKTLNEGNLPPRMNQDIIIPVLLPFINKHKKDSERTNKQGATVKHRLVKTS